MCDRFLQIIVVVVFFFFINKNAYFVFSFQFISLQLMQNLLKSVSLLVYFHFISFHSSLVCSTIQEFIKKQLTTTASAFSKW